MSSVITPKIDIGLNVTRRCNLRCSFCYYNNLHFVGNKKISTIIPGVDLPLNEACGKLSKYNISSIYICGGEPFTYPLLKQLLDWLIPRTEKIYISTNGLLVSKEWVNYIAAHNITLLASVKSSSKLEYNKLIDFYAAGIKVHLYHVLTSDSMEVLKSFSKKYYWVEKIRLLIETHTNPTKNDVIPAEEWFSLLKRARIYLNEIIDIVEVEMGYVDKANNFAQSDNRGAVNRTIIDVDLKMYPCPLLVENDTGTIYADFPENCTKDECPVLYKEADNSESNYIQICPFMLTDLRTAVEYIYYQESM